MEVSLLTALIAFLNASNWLQFLNTFFRFVSFEISILNLLAEKLKFSKNLKNFMFLLIEKRRIFFVEKIIDSFLKLCAQKRGEVKASLISSKELSETELENISKELSSSTSSTIKFNYKVDKELIGGLKLQLGSFMIDTSIKNKLNKYKQKMLES